MDILNYIPYGKNNAISREKLVKKTGLNDRAIRELIFIARRENIILNLQNGKGYFRPLEDEKEIVEKWFKQEEKRAKSILWALKPVREFIKENQQ